MSDRWPLLHRSVKRQRGSQSDGGWSLDGKARGAGHGQSEDSGEAGGSWMVWGTQEPRQNGSGEGRGEQPGAPGASRLCPGGPQGHRPGPEEPPLTGLGAEGPWAAGRGCSVDRGRGRSGCRLESGPGSGSTLGRGWLSSQPEAASSPQKAGGWQRKSLSALLRLDPESEQDHGPRVGEVTLKESGLSVPASHISRAQSEAGPGTPAPHAGVCLVGLRTVTLIQQQITPGGQHSLRTLGRRERGLHSA